MFVSACSLLVFAFSSYAGTLYIYVSFPDPHRHKRGYSRSRV